MKALILTLTSVCLGLVAASAGAADDAMMKKNDAMAKDGMGKPMTMQECKDHMAMTKKDGMKKDDAMMKKDTMCADMMKKDGAMHPGTASEPMKK
jgi:hypothetical protein